MGFKGGFQQLCTGKWVITERMSHNAYGSTDRSSASGWCSTRVRDPLQSQPIGELPQIYPALQNWIARAYGRVHDQRYLFFGSPEYLPERLMTIKTDGARNGEELDDVDPTLAGLDPGNPRLVFPHALRKIALAQVSGLPLADQ
jgi:hypothetical protein